MLVVRDRSGQTVDFRLDKLNAHHITAVLEPLIDKDAILCTNGARVYQAFARLTGIAHRPINVKKGIRVVDGVFHLQNVTAYDSRLKGWMRRFHGVPLNTWSVIWAGDVCVKRYRKSISPADCLREALGRFQSQ